MQHKRIKQMMSVVLAILISTGNTAGYAAITTSVREPASSSDVLKFISLYTTNVNQPLTQADHEGNTYQSVPYVPNEEGANIEL
ncbi:hypothetical protein QE109_12690 [Fusibacter bizertensis]|uniref:Uncharacterized protein n=1 Tax=Fusibacter bizertensis TaxID=1488331 RepID=A0ABT6NF12_9FIRM|nr:hypothetical protein [Fusibacter bizertensis]MDH8679010.1 hypothetical protein [Fusibacter bizertensis]